MLNGQLPRRASLGVWPIVNNSDPREVIDQDLDDFLAGRQSDHQPSSTHCRQHRERSIRGACNAPGTDHAADRPLGSSAIGKPREITQPPVSSKARTGVAACWNPSITTSGRRAISSPPSGTLLPDCPEHIGRDLSSHRVSILGLNPANDVGVSKTDGRGRSGAI